MINALDASYASETDKSQGDGCYGSDEFRAKLLLWPLDIRHGCYLLLSLIDTRSDLDKEGF